MNLFWTYFGELLGMPIYTLDGYSVTLGKAALWSLVVVVILGFLRAVFPDFIGGSNDGDS